MMIEIPYEDARVIADVLYQYGYSEYGNEIWDAIATAEALHVWHRDPPEAN